MKKVLITGALGQNGKILSSIYTNNNYKVFGFIKKNKKDKIRKVIYKVNNLLSKKKIKNNLKKINPDIIIHLASINKSYSKRLKKDEYYENYLINFKITKNLVDAIIELNIKPKFIFAGSSLMFGNIKKKTVTEKDIFKSKDYYSKYKIDAYKYIKKKSHNNFFATTLILFNHDSKFRDSTFIIPTLVKAFQKKQINIIKKIYDLNISGDFSHAEDICKGIYKLSLMKKNIEKIILSSGKRFYLNKIIHFLENKFNLSIQKNKNPKNKKNYKIVGSNILAKKILNYKQRKTPIDACREILQTHL